ncbi:MAG: class I SAM-dependent methyltransferase [Candidatus Acidiferrales bacterium]
MSASKAKSYADVAVAELYDTRPIVRDRGDVKFYCAYAARFLKRGDSILELGCGTGRVLAPLAKDGHKICGLDLSAAMLEQCRKRLEAESAEVKSRVHLVEANMAGFNLGEKFRLIIIPFRPFQHLLDVEEQLACLRSVHAHLENGGRLIVDFFQTDAQRMHDAKFLEERETDRDLHLPDGRRLGVTERIVAYHRARQVNDCELAYYITHPDGRNEKIVHAFHMRYFFRYEVEHLLARCGFRVASLYGNFDRSVLTDDSPEMLFIAEKSGD